MSLIPSNVASANEDYYFALDSVVNVPQILSQAGNTISLSDGGGSVNVASTTAVALSTQKLTAQTYSAGLQSTNFAGQVVATGLIRSAPPLGAGSATLNGGSAEVTVSAATADPTLRFQKNLSPDATVAYDGTKIIIDMPVDMSGQNIINGADVTLKGAAPSVNFQNTSGIQKATVDYSELVDRVTVFGKNASMDTNGVGYPRILLEDNIGVTLRTDDLPVKLDRYEATGVSIDTHVQVDTGGKMTISSQTSNIGGIRFEGQGSKGGDLYADEGTGSVQLVAGGGLALNMESASAVSVATSSPDTSVTMLANGGSASLYVEDVASVGKITADVGSGQLIANSGNFNLTMDGTTGDATWSQGGLANFNFAGGWSNVAGNFTVDTGYVELGDINYNINHTRIIINDSPGTIEFAGDQLLSGSASGNSGQHLNITINGTPYKIKLETP